MGYKGRSRVKALLPFPTKFRGLVLDEFQAEAIMRLRQDTSTIVSAPTGTGKTLVADYLVDMVLGEAKRVVYTGPIKALVSQKYRSFVAAFGKENVGIMTGDVSLCPEAPVVVMTTEIFRNMLLQEPENLSDVAWVIIDEIHFLDHDERGTVWEEAILFMPPGMRLLGLSATVPNARGIGDWIQTLHNDPVAVIQHDERAVPLVHLFFNEACQAVSRDGLLRSFVGTVLPGSDELDPKAGALDFAEVWDSPRVRSYRDTTSHLDLVNYVARQRLFPCLFFVFSRRGCEERAAELSRRRSFLSAQERETVRVAVKRTLEELELTRTQIPEIDRMEEQWRRGVAVHHAGLLPAVKRIVEVLLERRVLRVVYATETFAVGVNMPVRCVCFDSLQKYDGNGYRSLTQQEYFQMAGRAGRRGADRKGTVVSMVDFSALAKTRLPEWDETALEPIRSRMRLTFNMTANLGARMSDAEVRMLCGRTLGSYQEPCDELKEPDGVPMADRLFADYLKKKGILRSLGFLDGDTLSAKGESLRSVYVKELLVTELLYSDLLLQLSVPHLAGLVAALAHSARVNDVFPITPQPWMTEVGMIAGRLERLTKGAAGDQTEVLPHVAGPVAHWASGGELVDVLKGIPMQSGDFVTLCRQVVDLLRQMTRARRDHTVLRRRLKAAMAAVDRDVVQVHL